MGIPAARMDHNQAWDASTLSGRRCVSCVLGPGRPHARCLPVDEPFEVLAHVRNISSLVERVGLLLERSSGVLGQPLLVVTTHNGIASRSASARTAGRRPSAGTTSTGTPSTSLSSRSNRPNVTRLDRGDRSTRMSTSLSEVSSPRATLPNTRTLEARNFSAVASTCLRRCLRRRPSAVSGNPGSAPGAGSSRTSNRWPVAAISRSRVPNDGSRRPDSYALTTLWATCARRATSVCDKLARVRASRSSEPGEEDPDSMKHSL